MPEIAHAAGSAKALQAGGDVDPVAVEIPVILVDHVAQVDADPEADALLLGCALSRARHALLDQDRAATASTTLANSTERTVAHQLDDAALVLGDERLDDLPAMRLEPGEGAVLVALHQPRIPNNIG